MSEDTEKCLAVLETKLDNINNFINEDLKPLINMVNRHELQIKAICWVGGIVLSVLIAATLTDILKHH